MCRSYIYLVDVIYAKDTYVKDGWYISKPRMKYAIGPFASEQAAKDFVKALTNEKD